MICKLALEDGCVFTGEAFGATGTRTGEVVFNTAMTGYQEIFTDPSYCGQIVNMTFPLIGNYGVNPDDFESAGAHLSGFVVKELPTRPSNHRAVASIEAMLAEQGVIGLAGIDTRALTRRVRLHGAVRGVISTEIADELRLVELATQSPSMTGANLVERVAPADTRAWEESPGRQAFGEASERATAWHIVAIDCGLKHNIARRLVEEGGRVTVVPAGITADRIRELRPDGIVVGNGPGDPAAVTGTVETLRELLGTVPMLGVCLGHQMLSLALGGETYKLKFGHHGANVPVMNQVANRVEITSQNHGFAVDVDSIARRGATITHMNLNDGSLEGFVHTDLRVAAVQFHPEASPGPHDAGYMFRSFVASLEKGKAIDMASVFV
jgi:carbamoyl-phosphate synthase small subunit